jgi:uncharacterized HAD superfamily protein
LTDGDLFFADNHDADGGLQIARQLGEKVLFASTPPAEAPMTTMSCVAILVLHCRFRAHSALNSKVLQGQLYP